MSMLNFVKIVKQLDLDVLPIFRNKVVFRILFDIYSKGKINFRSLFKCLVNFIEPSVLNISLINIQGSGKERSLRQTNIFGVGTY